LRVVLTLQLKLWSERTPNTYANTHMCACTYTIKGRKEQK